MLYQVGLNPNKQGNPHDLLNPLIGVKSKISSVYFYPLNSNFPSARACKSVSKLTQDKFFNNLLVLSKSGFRLNMIINGLCYGQDAHTKAYLKYLDRTIRFYLDNFQLKEVTFTDIHHALFCKDRFPTIERHASVNLFIKHIAQYEYATKIFNVINIDRSQNYNMVFLQELKKQFPNTKLKILLNESCLHNCIQRVSHFNVLSHGRERSFVKHCNERFAKNLIGEILASSYIFPQYLPRYSFVDVLKITRFSMLDKAISAYISGDYSSMPLVSFAECLGIQETIHNMDGKIKKEILKIKFKDIPEEHFIRRSQCANNCTSCNYCYDLGVNLVA